MKCICIGFCIAFTAFSQTLFESEDGSRPRLVPSDWGLLESADNRNEMGCTISWSNPSLSYDLKYRPHYEALIPLDQLSPALRLSIIFRVTPSQGDPRYFIQKWTLPQEEWPMEKASSAQFRMLGSFDLGPGTYKIDWILRDSAGRACTSRPMMTVPASNGLRIAPNEIAASSQPIIQSECRESGTSGKPVHLFVNYNSARPGTASLDERDREAYLSLIQVFAQDCSIPTVRLTVFDLERKKLLFQDDTGKIDLPTLQKALDNTGAGTIGVNALEMEKSSYQFLQGLLENTSSSPQNDPILFVGPAAPVYAGVNDELPASVCPHCVYLHYEPAPHMGMWMDIVGKWMSKMRARKFVIRQPGDFLKAMPEVLRVLRGESTASLRQ